MTTHMEKAFADRFGHMPQFLCSAPGRTELGGNHTDHQNGCVLAGAVDLLAVAAAAPVEAPLIRVYSEGYGLCQISLTDLAVRPEQFGSTVSLIRGVASRFAAAGSCTFGFDAYVRSEVLPGSGLSSSAAFEVLIAGICNHIYCQDRLSPVELAKISQYAENVYFGKPCGLMDQTACAVGGIVGIDFANPAQPMVSPIRFDPEAFGYDLFVVDSGADHADLSKEYAAIPHEMRSVARQLGQQFLREVEPSAFWDALQQLRQVCGDRACLRAVHFFQEQERVTGMISALQGGDFAAFLKLVEQSGQSSWTLLQNVSVCGSAAQQPLALALATAQQLLDGAGACRVHGGGFAGTILAFVPAERSESFQAGMERILGEGCCKKLRICQSGVTVTPL